MSQSWFIVAALVCSLVAVGASAQSPDEIVEHVMELTPLNFDSFIAANRAVFVEFYAPWCKFCANFAPDFAELGQLTAMSGTDRVAIAKIDGSKHKDISQKYGVTGYPTLLLFRGVANHTSYESGERTVRALIRHLNAETGSNITLVRPPSVAQELYGSAFDRVIGDANKSALILFYSPSCPFCVKIFPYFDRVAESLRGERGLVVGRLDTRDPSHAIYRARYNIKYEPAVFWFPKGVPKEGKLYDPVTDTRTVDAELIAWVNQLAGTHRQLGGLREGAGRDAVLDDLAEQFAERASTDVARRIAARVEELEGSTAPEHQFVKQHARVYATTVEKMQSVGVDYPKWEIARVERVLRGQLTPEKRDALRVKLNILERFANFTAVEWVLRRPGLVVFLSTALAALVVRVVRGE